MGAMRWVLCAVLGTLCLLIAAPAQATHPRPKSASEWRVSLVPADAQCAAPNSTHGPPLAFPSCNPPAQTSGQATVGTPDAFGGPANFSGWFTFQVMVGTPGPPDDTDVRVRMDLVDVRCMPASAHCGAANDWGPSDYAGQMGFSFTVRSSDHFNAAAPGGGIDPATMQDVAMGSGILCAETASTSTGSTCRVRTSYNAFLPGSAKDTKRVVQETDDLHVYDSGADNDFRTTGDNTVFLRPGVFIP